MKRLHLFLILFGGLLLIPHLAAVQHSHDDELPDLDTRKAKAHTTPAATRAVQNLKRLLPDVDIEVDTVSGAPSFISTRKGFLTGKNGLGRGISTNTAMAFPKNEPHRVTKAFIREHQDLFGRGPEALQAAMVNRSYTTAHNGLKTTIWQQQLDGIPIFEALFIAHVTKDEELVNVSSRFIADVAKAADRGAKDRNDLLKKLPISARQAIAFAAQNIEEEVNLEEIEPLDLPKGDRRRQQKFKAADLPGEIHTELVWLPIHSEELRLCWQVILSEHEGVETFLVLVDATTGEVLVRRGLTRHATSASYRVFTGESPTPMSPGHSSPQTNQPSLVARELVTLSAINTNASPLGWINEDVNETLGNNVIAHINLNGDNIPDSRPQGSPFRVFDPPLDLDESPYSNGDASVVNLFYWCNWMHDKLYELGFTEEAGNFQANNFGRGGIGGDPVVVDAQINTAINLATFTTLPDGNSGRMRMFIYSKPGSGPDRDPSLDAQMILHEYTHGLSDRLVAGGMALNALQSRGLAEGWSDFYALALLSDPTNDVHASYPFAAYVSQKLFSPEQNYYFGLRRYPYSTDLAKNPLTFKDIDPNQIEAYEWVPKSPLHMSGSFATNFHNQGEIWCSALWDARANLITKHGFAGNQLMLQLVTDGMKLCPPKPNFLHARDAILKADEINNGGANHPELWAAFAKRGMGFFATSPASSTTVGVVQSFALPDHLSISVSAGMISSGPTGGPFLPNVQNYTLSNTGPDSLTWSIQGSANWLTFSQSTGTLTTATSESVTISINQGVSGSLPSGLYTNNVTFHNQTSGIQQHRKFYLRVGQADAFTELFDANDFDLSHRSFTFTPDGTSDFYSVCQETVTEFPSDPTNGTVLNLDDDDFIKITLPMNVSLYGITNNEIFVSDNGYITFSFGDKSFSESFETHFARQRISALFRDFVPNTNNISWKQFGDRIAITYLDIPEGGTFRTNSFQIELFFDGRIRITYLQMQTRNGLVGLSRGINVPSGFLENDFSHYLQCGPPLGLTVPAYASEDDGILYDAGQVTIPESLLTNLTIKLFSSDNTQASVPLEIILPAGQTNVTFDINVVDDEFFDGTQSLTISALASGYQLARASMNIHDNEDATLIVTLPESMFENDGMFVGTVSIDNLAAAADVVVHLESSDPWRVQVPASLTILAGHASAAFQATIIDDKEINGNSLITITAHVTGWNSGTGIVMVIDDENRNLQLRIPTTAREGNGVLPGAGSVHISGLWPEDLVVNLDSSAPSAISIPLSVIIPGGKSFTTFDITIGDDTVLNNPESVQITASRDDFISDQKTLVVSDNETPLPASNPDPVHLSTDNPVTITLRWNPAFGEGFEQITNGGFESGSFAGWSLETNNSSTFNIFAESYFATNFGTFVSALAGHFSAVARQTNLGLQTLSREIALPNSEVLMLGWADRILNTSGMFSSNHQFRVELRDTNGVPLEVLFATEADHPSSTPWTQRHYNLAPFCEQTVRLAFVLEASTPGMSVFLDEISVLAGNPPLTTYDVYFSTDSNPETLLGSTTNLFWELPTLDPYTTYYWKVVSRRIGEVSSPIWQFYTTPTIEPPSFHTVELTGDQLTLIWNALTGTTYRVQYTTSLLNPTWIDAEDVIASNSSATFSDMLTGETQKYYRLLVLP